jgi:hypothetical protein
MFLPIISAFVAAMATDSIGALLLAVAASVAGALRERFCGVRADDLVCPAGCSALAVSFTAPGPVEQESSIPRASATGGRLLASRISAVGEEVILSCLDLNHVNDAAKMLTRGARDHLDDIRPTLFIRTMFKAANAVQIRVTIDEIEPGIWRHLVLPVHWNLEHLHLGIQAAFNWWNYHLYEFRIGGLRYGDVVLLRRMRPMTTLGCSTRGRFARWTSSKVPSLITTMIWGMAGATPLR